MLATEIPCGKDVHTGWYAHVIPLHRCDIISSSSRTRRALLPTCVRSGGHPLFLLLSTLPMPQTAGNCTPVVHVSTLWVTGWQSASMKGQWHLWTAVFEAVLLNTWQEACPTLLRHTMSQVEDARLGINVCAMFDKESFVCAPPQITGGLLTCAMYSIMPTTRRLLPRQNPWRTNALLTKH